MAKRRKLTAPDPQSLSELEDGFAAKPVSDLMGLAAPIAKVAAEGARLADPLDPDRRVLNARDAADAEKWRTADADGRVIMALPVEAIRAEHLIRDRVLVDPDDMAELRASILAHGVRLPIEVEPLGEEYGLISGWRRLVAVRELQADGKWKGPIPAIVRAPKEASDAYVSMVEENEVRAALTPYERGRIAVMAVRQGVFASLEEAVDVIFATASKAKRSKIRGFALIHEELGDMLTFPASLSEKNGLRLANALRTGFAAKLRAELAAHEPGDAATEWNAMARILADAEAKGRREHRGGRPRNSVAEERIDLADGVYVRKVQDGPALGLMIEGSKMDEALIDDIINALQKVVVRSSP
jgi:ParB family chromosome partitioning protein